MPGIRGCGVVLDFVHVGGCREPTNSAGQVAEQFQDECARDKYHGDGISLGDICSCRSAMDVECMSECRWVQVDEFVLADNQEVVKGTCSAQASWEQ